MLDLEYELEPILFEATQRGPEFWVPALRDWRERFLEKPSSREGSMRSSEILVLTALRRLEGRADPLTVEARWLESGPFEFPELPVVGVRLLYTEGETKSFSVRVGGDYRSGRLARWDMELSDFKGRQVLGVDNWESSFGGGLFQSGVASSGFVWGQPEPDEEERLHLQLQGQEVPETIYEPISLPLGRYQRPTSLGTYQVVVQYHNSVAIADTDDACHRLVFRSEPLAFEWVPRRIHYVPGARARIAEIIDSLLDQEEVLLVEFGIEDYQGLAEGDAVPLERLYAEGWGTIPLLIDRLDQHGSPEHNARLLAALQSLSGLRVGDAFTQGGAIGSCVVLGTFLPPGSGVNGLRLSARTQGLSPTLDAQKSTIKRWKSLRDGFVIEP